MKKKLKQGSGWEYYDLPKILRVMKLIGVFMFVALLQVSASSYSQTKELTIKGNHLTLEELFEMIENQSEFSFMYNLKQIDLSKEVNVNFNNQTVDKILNRVLKGSDITYTVNDRLIIIHKDKVELKDKLAEDQQRSVSGKVTDSSGVPLPGVTVVIKGTTHGTITNADGEYILTNVPENSILLFSFVGMRTQEISIESNSAVDVKMQEDAIGIEEVVAIGYGTQKKGNLTGSISSVKSEDMVVAPVASTSNSLAGRLPGLISVQRSGQPGADQADLSIRGFGNALIIVDGVETSFNNIDPNQIESVSILKDASASIYGSRAGNGVILVTTKRGNVNKKPIITLNSSFTAQTLTAFPRLMGSGQITELSRESWLNAGRPEETAPYTIEEIEKYYDGTDPQYPNTDWRALLIRDFAPQQQHNLSVRGGSDKIKYYGFIGYLDQESMWKSGNGGNFKRINLQSNIDAEITTDLSLRLDISAINEYRRYPWRSQKSALWEDFFQTFPMYPASLPDPTKLSYANGGGTGGAHFMTDSDIAGYENTDNQMFNTTLSLNYKVKWVKDLSLKAFVNVQQYNSFNKKFVKPLTFWTYDYASGIYTQAGALYDKAFLTEQSGRSRNITSQLSANYDHIFNENHHVSAFVLYEAIDYSSDYLYGERRDFPTSAIDQLFMGTIGSSKANGSATEMGRVSLVSRLNYSYKDKYLLESTFRADASAKFPKEKRWGYFPSVSVAWRMSEENFVKQDMSMVDNLKIRLSYGESGNDGVGNFQYLEGYRSGDAVMIGGSQVNGMVSTGLANPDLTWERISIYNAGMDFSFFKQKLFGEIDVFYRERNDIPATRLASLPSTFGATQPPENLNSMNTRGFELMFGTTGKISELNYQISGNISWSRSKWDYYEEPNYDDPDEMRLFQYSGRWTDYIYGYKTNGLFTSQDQIDALTYDMDGQNNQSLKPGDLIYLDTNDDGVVNWKDQVEIGKGTVPHMMLGANVNLQYKNFDLSALFQGAYGYYNYITPGNGQMPLFMFEMRWTEENNNANAFIPRPGSTSSAGGGISDHYYKKAGYLRLKTFSLGYNFSDSVLSSIGMEKIRVYFAVTNLFTVNKLRKFEIDPEAPSGNTGQSYPQQMTLTLGLNISF